MLQHGYGLPEMPLDNWSDAKIAIASGISDFTLLR